MSAQAAVVKTLRLCAVSAVYRAAGAGVKRRSALGLMHQGNNTIQTSMRIMRRLVPALVCEVSNLWEQHSLLDTEPLSSYILYTVLNKWQRYMISHEMGRAATRPRLLKHCFIIQNHPSAFTLQLCSVQHNSLCSLSRNQIICLSATTESPGCFYT